MRRANVRFTYSDYLLLPEDKRYEILDGDLCRVPAPTTRHQRVGLNLKLALHKYVREKDLGLILDAPCDVVLSPENVVQPDILFVGKERNAVIGDANIQGAPDIVVEILSESTRRKDLEVKRKVYAAFGVPEYWIVDPEAQTVEVLVWTEKGYESAAVYRNADCIASPLFPDLNLALPALFQP